MPKYKVGDRLKPQVSSNRITITGITEINYVVQYTQGANIGHEILWAIDGIDNSVSWTLYKEPRKTETRFVGVLENSNGDILTSPSTWRNRYSLERSYKHSAYKLIDIIEINYEEKS